MIEKKGKGNRVVDLRTIYLAEIDFCFNSKVIAGKILNYDKANHLLPKE